MDVFKDYLSSSVTIPNRRHVRLFESLSSPLLIFPALLLVISVIYFYPRAFYFIGAWFLLVTIYTSWTLYLKYIRRLDNWLVKQESLMLHSVIGLFAIALIQICIIWLYKPDVPDFENLAFWGLYLVPLFIISRHGSTSQLVFINLLACALIVVPRVAGSILFHYGKNLDILIVSLMQIGFLEIFSISYHIMVRRSREDMVLLETNRGTSLLLAEQDTFKSAYEKVAQIIQSVYRPDIVYVFILLCEPNSDRLRVVGATGKDRRYWHHLELDGKGITSQVFKTGEPICARDVHEIRWRDIVFLPEGFEDVASEVAVPIRYQGKVVGVLDVESPRKNEFDTEDILTIQRYADNLAISFGHFVSLDTSTRDAYKLAPEIIDAGDEHTDFEGWFRDIAEASCSNLNASGIAMIRLARGTRYPISPISIWPKPLAKSLKLSVKSLSAQSILWECIRLWETRVWTNLDKWENFADPQDRMNFQALAKNGVRALVFIPIGSAENPLMVVFCTFNTEQVLGDVQRLAFLAFAAAIEKSFQALQMPPTQIKKTGLVIHRILASSTQKLFAQIDAIQRKYSENDLADDLRELQQGIRELREQLKRETVGERYILNEMELAQALASTAHEFEELRPEDLRIVFTGIEALEDDPLVLRQIYYNFIVEAIANSVEHGKASLVEVSAVRMADQVRIEIKDNGSGLPKNPDQTKPFGIFYYSRQLKQELDATVDFHSNNPRGTRVVLEIPVIPMETIA